MVALAEQGIERALSSNPGLAHGVNARNGDIGNPAVAATLHEAMPSAER